MVHRNVHQPHVSLLLFTKEVNYSMSTYSHCCFDIVFIKNCIGLKGILSTKTVIFSYAKLLL
jgi:hypothetical protein